MARRKKGLYEPDATAPDMLEELVQVVAGIGHAYVEEALQALMPDGRAFGKEKRPAREELAEYLTLRGNKFAWDGWFTAKLQEVLNQIRDLPPEIQMAVHPYNLTATLALNFMQRNEKRLQSEESKATAALRPTAALPDDDGSLLFPNREQEVADDDEEMAEYVSTG